MTKMADLLAFTSPAPAAAPLDSCRERPYTTSDLNTCSIDKTFIKRKKRAN